jgi:hypothetical protein
MQISRIIAQQYIYINMPIIDAKEKNGAYICWLILLSYLKSRGVEDLLGNLTIILQ